MAILAFQKPDKVLMLEADSKFGKFEFRPLEPGFGITVGNALRRILRWKVMQPTQSVLRVWEI